MPDPTDPWHPYRSTVEDHLGSCTDYLGRLRRSLAGEIAPDRRYFADKAHQLHAATRRMVRLVQDIDSWLGECTAQTNHVESTGERYVVDCSLPAGHHGCHDDGDRLLPGRRLTGGAAGSRAGHRRPADTSYRRHAPRHRITSPGAVT